MERFEAFETRGDPQLIKMKAEAVRFVCDMADNKPPRWLSLLGTSGSGKTMLARIISRFFRAELRDGFALRSPAKEVRKRGGFITWHTVVGELRSRNYDILDDISGDWFLALDDIGSEYGSAFVTQKLYELMQHREHRWTVVTGNLSLATISSVLDTRIASRMIRHGSTVVEVDVPDWNIRQPTL